MNRVVVGMVLLVVAAVSFGYYFNHRKLQVSGQPLADTKVTTRSFQVTTHVTGVLDARQAYMVSSEINGLDGKIIFLVEDGSRVKKGDVLVRLDPAIYQRQVKQLIAEVAGLKAAVKASDQNVEFEKNQVELEIKNSRYNLEVAALDLQRLKDGDGPLRLSTLKDEVDKASYELMRYQGYYRDLVSLKNDGFENVSELENASEQVSIYQEKYNTAKERYKNYKEHIFPSLLKSGQAKSQNAKMMVEQTTKGGKHKIAKAMAAKQQIEARLESKKAALKNGEEKLKNTIIKAPFDGIIIHYETFRDGQKRKPRVGDSVLPNQPILYLPDITKMVVKSRALEMDLHKLATGQKGVVSVDAYPDRKYEAELVFIGALATTDPDSKEKYFDITFNLIEEDLKLRPGMSCQVSVLSRNVENVLSVPVESVFYDGNKPYCLLKKTLGGYERRPVSVGTQNDEFVEIISGLAKGDQVSLVYQPE